MNINNIYNILDKESEKCGTTLTFSLVSLNKFFNSISYLMQEAVRLNSTVDEKKKIDQNDTI